MELTRDEFIKQFVSYMMNDPTQETAMNHQKQAEEAYRLLQYDFPLASTIPFESLHLQLRNYIHQLHQQITAPPFKITSKFLSGILECSLQRHENQMDYQQQYVAYVVADVFILLFSYLLEHSLDQKVISQFLDADTQLNTFGNSLSYSNLSDVSVQQWKELHLTQHIERILSLLIGINFGEVNDDRQKYDDSLFRLYKIYFHIIRDRILHIPEASMELLQLFLTFLSNPAVLTDTHSKNIINEVEETIFGEMVQLAASESIRQHSTARRQLLSLLDQLLAQKEILISKLHKCLSAKELSTTPLHMILDLFQFYIQPNGCLSVPSQPAIKVLMEYGVLRLLLVYFIEQHQEKTNFSGTEYKKIIKLLVWASLFYSPFASFMSQLIFFKSPDCCYQLSSNFVVESCLWCIAFSKPQQFQSILQDKLDLFHLNDHIALLEVMVLLLQNKSQFVSAGIQRIVSSYVVRLKDRCRDIGPASDEFEKEKKIDESLKVNHLFYLIKSYHLLIQNEQQRKLD